MAELLFWLTAIGYSAGAGGYLVYIIRQNEGSARWADRVMMLGLALHTGQLIVVWVGLGHVPAVGLTQSLNFFAWAVVAGYLAVRFKTNVKVLGSFVAPLALFLMLLAAGGGIGKPAEPVAGFNSVWLALHVATALLGDGIFAVAFLAGVMYLLQERAIKGKRFGWLYSRLPSLTSLDGLNRTCLVFGFPLLTVGMLTGALYAQLATGVYWRWDAKEVWSLITWVVYAVLLHQRLTVGWQGRRAAWMAIVGFGLVIFTFLGASLLMSGYHDFGKYGLNG